MMMDRDRHDNVIDEVQSDSRRRSATYVRKKELEKEIEFSKRGFRICMILAFALIGMIVSGLLI